MSRSVLGQTGGWWLGAVVAAATMVTACGGKTVVEPGLGGNGGSGGSGGVVSSTSSGGGQAPGAQPPPPPVGAPPGDGPGYAFVIDKLFMGDTDRNGVPNLSAWKQYGYDIDGKISTKSSTDLCQPAAGGSPTASYPDGNDGIDNAFGKMLLPIYLGLAVDASQQVNLAIADGQFSYLMDIRDLGSAPSYLGLSARAYRGSWLGSVPAFDGSDVWPVTAESLANPADLLSALDQFPASYLADQVFVTSPPGLFHLALPVGDFPTLVMTLHHATLSMRLSPDRQSAVDGVISGILDTEQYIEAFRTVAGTFDTGLCNGTTFDSLADQIRQTSDILLDGSQDPAQTCTGISLGMGFEASLVQLGPVAAPVPPPPDPCQPPPGG